MIRSIALVVALVTVAPSWAAEPGTPSAKELIARQKRCLSAMSALVSKVAFARTDVETYLAEWKSFDALDDGSPDEDVAGPECVDLSKALSDPKVLAWARARRLDPKEWLLKSTRITLTFVKRRMPAQLAEMKAQMASQRQALEQGCQKMGPTACRDVKQAFAAGDELMRETAGMMGLLPDPSKAEAALLDEYGDRLRTAVEGGDRDDMEAAPPNGDAGEEQED